MKKWLIAFLLFFLILVAFLYLFIPNKLSINKVLFIKANAQGVYRSLEADKTWEKWWPEKNTIPATDNPEPIFYLDGYTFKITGKSTSSIFISISDKDISTETLLHVIPLKIDSVKLIWRGEISTSPHPVKRLQKYLKAKELENDIEKIFEKMKLFFSKNENIYGTPIKEERVVDSILVSTYATSAGYPTTPFIYDLFNRLRNYIRSQSAKETGNPMLNVSTTDSVNFLTKVAIPVNKKLRDSGTISYKRMLGGGKILVIEIKGGPYSIKNGFTKIEHYVNDYNRASPAIPFQSLVTDRIKEPDTSKWITRIFWPVM